VDHRGGQARVRDGYLRGALSRPPTPSQVAALAAFVEAGGSVADAAELVGIRPSTVKRHLADLRAKSGLSTEQLIYAGRAAGWLVVPSLEPTWTDEASSPGQDWPRGLRKDHPRALAFSGSNA
jgi:hypothetical protein